MFVYAVMDGFDLGLGILFPLFPRKSDRDVIVNSVSPVWDGNEKPWLVLGGGGLMAGVSPGLCGADAGALYADDRDAARPGVPRRRLRIPLAHPDGAQQMGHLLSPAARCWQRWRRASRWAPILQGVPMSPPPPPSKCRGHLLQQQAALLP